MEVESPYRALLEARAIERVERVVAGTRTVWFVYGDASLPALVLVHGFRGDHHGLESIAAHLPSHRVVIPDLPGFGESEAPADSSVHGYAAWLRAFVDEVAPGAPVLGHSFGSIVVAAAAASGLDASRIVLVNPIAQPALEGSQRLGSLATLAYYRVAARLPQRAGEALLASPVIVRGMSIFMAKSRDRRMRGWIHDQHDRYFSAFASRESVLGAFETSISANVGQFAADVHQPVLLIAADRDDVTPLEAQHELTGRFPDATLAVLHDVGHLVHYEQPDQAAMRIRRFLAA